ncbi:hypothetical protein HELRODRAFT_188378 [Helobdella robusta]|uniref:WAPL domain-containing protein n=1 Tax=Helobdella robusta TaxID=6412 RepID=T1FPX7_HELRO|nr:hypothetical protein HELRODRAFT_188378 [Helobdella robusta]ESO06518.1 hypothetical protein HELRODRAFT_188378 [Helobdella robusta]
MEALLRFSSRKDADVLRDDLRILGGFDRIIDATCLSIDEFDGYYDRKRTDAYDDDDGDDGGEKDKIAVEVDGGLDIFNMKLMNKIENFFQVLANVTNLNEANQTHLIMHKCLKRCVQYLKKAKFVEVNGKLDKECSGYIVYNLIISLLNVFINITHDNTCGSTKAGSSIQLVENLFTCLLTANQNLPACCQFDLIVLCLGLLINLVEHCRSNLRILLDIHLPHSSSPESSSLRALGNFFTYHYESARQFEEEHDAELEKEQQLQQQQQQRQFSIDNNNKNTLANNKLVDCSGEWVESEMGVEWVSHHLNTNSNNNSYDDDEDNKNKSNNNNKIALVNNHAKRGRQIADGQNHRLNSLFSQDNDSINKALNKAGKHMEDSVVAAYVALLIGCIVQHDLDLAEQVRDTLPDYSFESLSRMLRKFYNFMNLTQGMRPSCDKSILQVLEVLDSC